MSFLSGGANRRRRCPAARQRRTCIRRRRAGVAHLPGPWAPFSSVEYLQCLKWHARRACFRIRDRQRHRRAGRGLHVVPMRTSNKKACSIWYSVAPGQLTSEARQPISWKLKPALAISRPEEWRSVVSACGRSAQSVVSNWRCGLCATGGWAGFGSPRAGAGRHGSVQSAILVSSACSRDDRSRASCKSRSISAL